MQGKYFENLLKEVQKIADESGMEMSKNEIKGLNAKEITFKFLYKLQTRFQKEVCKNIGYKDEVQDLPIDNVNLFQFHCLSLLEEVGELVKSDKRWKNYRNDKYDKSNKLEELCDCFIVLMNICIFSGFSYDEVESAIIDKIIDNFDRVYKNSLKESSEENADNS